jgi:hypothetical protein
MIAAVALDKNPSKAIFSRAFIVVFNIRLEYGFRKIIILMDNNSENFFISQRFVRENDLINNSIKYIKKIYRWIYDYYIWKARFDYLY